jgi:hypothetical protein
VRGPGWKLGEMLWFQWVTGMEDLVTEKGLISFAAEKARGAKVHLDAAKTGRVWQVSRREGEGCVSHPTVNAVIRR